MSFVNIQVRSNLPMDTLGSRIKARRLAKGMTQRDLWLKSGVGQGDISKLENGSVAGSTKTVQLAHALGCDPLWLATGEGKWWGAPADESLELDARGGNVVGIEVAGASAFMEGDVVIEPDPSEAGLILGSGVHDGYAVKVDGDRNAPALKDGQFVVIERHATPREGDLHLFHMNDGNVLLRELLREDETRFHVDSPAWGARQTLAKDDVREVELVVAVVSSSRWRVLPK